MVFAVAGALACADDSAMEGSTSSGGTGDTGAEENGGDSGETGVPEEPGPDGMGCDEPWEDWWQTEQANMISLVGTPEGAAQSAAVHARHSLDELPPATELLPPATDSFRSTLIGEEAVLSTARNAALSWCMGAIEPNPRQPGGSINAERDAQNLARYETLRRETEHSMRIWERHSRMNFVHLAPLDDRRKPSGGMCDTALDQVWFRVQTRGCDSMLGLHGLTNAGGENEFDPAAGSPGNPEGYDRELCVARQQLDGVKVKLPYYVGHELGHVVGMDHEHKRWPQADSSPGNCKENHPFEALPANVQLTPRDPESIMGYGECVGSEHVYDISPSDMLGAYFTFNWAERRPRDLAPATGGRSQRLWGGSNDRPGILWSLPFPDRLIEWRFDAEQPGPQLSFDTIDRCIGDAMPCELGDAGGHWHPVMGQFTGASNALDVFMYSADAGEDRLLRARVEDEESFESILAPAPERAIPVVGNFGSGVRDQLLWYRPGPAEDALWIFAPDGSHETRAVNQEGWRIPLTGHFRSRTHAADIIWFDPRDATVDTWVFGPDFTVEASGPASAALLGVVEGTEYLPIVGNFDGNNQTDLFWYTPGPDPDWLWLSDSNADFALFESFPFAIDGDYHPLVGDFDADGDDDILWYRPAIELDSGPSWLWLFDGPSVDVRPLMIRGDYLPYVEDFDRDGCTDILWYDSVSPADGSPLWRCVPDQQTFSCEQRLVTPALGYPIGFDTGGY